MSISQQESGLTPEQYDALRQQNRAPAWSLVAHRVNPTFGFWDNLDGVSDPLDVDDHLFDAAIIRVGNHSYLVRVTVDSVDWYSGGNAGSIPLAQTSNPRHEPSVIVDGDSIVVFYATLSAIIVERYTFATDNLPAMTRLSSEEALSVIGVEAVAAVSPLRVHYLTLDTATNLFSLHVMEKTTDWVATHSDIFWTHPIQSFDAESLSDGTDVIVMVGIVPGDIAIEVVNTAMTKNVEIAGGPLAFTCRDGIWSDHREIEIVRNLTDWRYRRGIKLSMINDVLYCVVFSSDGTQDFPFGFYRYHTSLDGFWWSMGRALPLETGFSSFGCKLLHFENRIWAVEKKSIQLSSETLLFGEKNSSYALDITHDVTSLELTREKIAQMGIEISNRLGQYDNSPILNKDNVVWFELRAGYYYKGQRLMVPAGFFEVDTFTKNDETADRSISITARDFMQWMSDRSQSEQAHYWESQLIAGDTFIDETGTRYGGMRHTATQLGSFDTENSQLTLRSNNERGVAFSTFDPYIWNGSQQVKFALAENSGTEYAGVVFRAIDYENMWIAYYNQATDRIELIRVIDNNEQLVAHGLPKSWQTTPESFRWIRVEFRYAEIRVLISEDGVVWTEEINHLAHGLQPNQGGFVAPQPLIPDRGFVGYIGQGFSPEDSWDLDFSYEPPSISITLPDFDVNFDFNFDFGYSPSNNVSGSQQQRVAQRNLAIMWNDLGNFARSPNAYSSKIAWYNIDLPNGSLVRSACLDYNSSFYSEGFGACPCLVLSEDKDVPGTFYIYYSEDITLTELVWDLTFTFSTGAIVYSGTIQFDKSLVSTAYATLRTHTGTLMYRTINNGTLWEELVNRSDYNNTGGIGDRHHHDANSISGGYILTAGIPAFDGMIATQINGAGQVSQFGTSPERHFSTAATTRNTYAFNRAWYETPKDYTVTPEGVGFYGSPAGYDSTGRLPYTHQRTIDNFAPGELRNRHYVILGYGESYTIEKEERYYFGQPIYYPMNGLPDYTPGVWRQSGLREGGPYVKLSTLAPEGHTANFDGSVTVIRTGIYKNGALVFQSTLTTTQGVMETVVIDGYEIQRTATIENVIDNINPLGDYYDEIRRYTSVYAINNNNFGYDNIVYLEIFGVSFRIESWKTGYPVIKQYPMHTSAFNDVTPIYPGTTQNQIADVYDIATGDDQLSEAVAVLYRLDSDTSSHYIAKRENDSTSSWSFRVVPNLIDKLYLSPLGETFTMGDGHISSEVRGSRIGNIQAAWAQVGHIIGYQTAG